MRSSRVWPSLTIAVVDSMFSTSFVAVPAFMRLDPATTSGPTSTTIGTSGSRARREAGLHVMPIVAAAPRSRLAASRAASTYGARPLAEIPTTTSPART